MRKILLTTLCFIAIFLPFLIALFLALRLLFEGNISDWRYTGAEALRAVNPQAREEILQIFPELKEKDYTPVPARAIPTGRMQKQLVALHKEMGAALLDIHESAL